MDSPHLSVLLLLLLCTPLLRAAAQIIHSGIAQLRSKRTVDRSQEVGLHYAPQIANNVMTGVHLTCRARCVLLLQLAYLNHSGARQRNLQS